MISIVNYLYEGKIIEHLKRNKGKYLVGAGLAGAALAPEMISQVHKKIGQDLVSDAMNDKSGNEIDRAIKIAKGLKHEIQYRDWKNSPFNIVDKFRAPDKGIRNMVITNKFD